jgi:two-component system chemotaxis response regulator CheB
VESGPRENGHRPSVDVLFRSAAETFGPRVIGVVLTGALSDGALGLAAIKDHGGLAIVQHPEEAFAPGMPLSALRATAVDYTLRLAEIAPCLVRLTRRSARGRPAERTPAIVAPARETPPRNV